MDSSKKLPICYQSSTINKVDYDSFLPNRWLTSECINFFFEYLLNEQFQDLQQTVLLMDPSCCQLILFESDFEDLKDSLKRISFNQYKYILIPVNNSIDCDTAGSGDHWALLIFEASSQQFYYYDSMNSRISNSDTLAKRIRGLYLNDIKAFTSVQDIKVNSTTPKQSNSYDCGMYVLTIAEQILHLISNSKNNQLYNSDAFKVITPQYISKKRQEIRSFIDILARKK